MESDVQGLDTDSVVKHFAEAAVISVATLLGFMLPVTTAQVLLVNMITEITLSLALYLKKVSLT